MHKKLQSLVGLFSFAAKVIYPGRAFLRRPYNVLTRGKYLHCSKPIAEDLLWWEKFLFGWIGVTHLRSRRPCYSLWTDASGFRDTGGYFLPRHFTLQEFRENMPTCNKICTPSGITGFSSSEAALLSLDNVLSYRFSMRQWAKRINFKEMTAVLQALDRWIETFKRPHLHIFCDNFQ